jgi:hypothetical protein
LTAWLDRAPIENDARADRIDPTGDNPEMGIPKDRAKDYEAGLKRGGILFGFTPRPEHRADCERDWSVEHADVRRR